MLIPGGMKTHFFDDRHEQYKPGPDQLLNDPRDVAEAVVFALRQPPGRRAARAARDARGRALVAVVLIYRALGLGDFLTGVPAFRALRRAFPEHRIVLAAPRALAPLAALTGAIDEVVDTAPLGPAPRGADVAVNLHGRGPQSTALLREQRRAARLIAFGDGWRADEHEVHRWCRLLERARHPRRPGGPRPATRRRASRARRRARR